MRSTGSCEEPPPDPEIRLQILEHRVKIGCPDRKLRKVIQANFGAMATPGQDAASSLEYQVHAHASSYSVICDGHPPQAAQDIGDLLFVLEKEITVELQKRKPDRLFLHSAAVEWKGQAYLLAGDSGSGKSLVTWALLHEGFGYLSDELSAVDLHNLEVAPYPHALCLKQPPPPPYALPREAIHLGRTIHIPVPYLPPGSAISEPRSIGAVFLLRHGAELPNPDLRRIGPAEAGARLYLNALNALSHPNRGLDAVLRIAEHVPSFTVASAGLRETCALIRAAVEHACSYRKTSA